MTPKQLVDLYLDVFIANMDGIAPNSATGTNLRVAITDLVQAMILDEREACAVICDKAASIAADRIRARGEGTADV